MAKLFVESQQFKGVYPDPAKVAIAQAELAKPPHERTLPPDVISRLMQRPAFDGKVSLYFSDGSSFDIQEDHNTGKLYLVLPREPGAHRARVYEGEWLCLLPSGKFIKLTDQDYRSMTGSGDPIKPSKE